MDEVSLTYTGIMKQGDKKVVKVRFARNGEKDFAEGVIPGGKIKRVFGKRTCFPAFLFKGK